MGVLIENCKFRFIAVVFFLTITACTGKKEDKGSIQWKQEVVKETNQDFKIEDYPLVFRRTTLIVRDIKKSLALYQDVLGMEIIYDKILIRKHPEKDQDHEVRLVFLKATNSYYGVLGLMEYSYNDPSKFIKPIRKEGFTAQNSVLLFNTNDLEGRFEKIKNTAGVEIITAPTLREYPSYDGKGVIRVKVSIFYDPDGFLVEFNEPQDKINVEK
ncbi:VOC family protein [uncultured Maribacter sp.]|uniref:VOC family protein n=1 Tax=uncultured Maribacter sp. TaxID=431308 RepID=UPI00261D7CF9|nr:VOC family protein [uncultured Maribacter sp.]